MEGRSDEKNDRARSQYGLSSDYVIPSYMTSQDPPQYSFPSQVAYLPEAPSPAPIMESNVVMGDFLDERITNLEKKIDDCCNKKLQLYEGDPKPDDLFEDVQEEIPEIQKPQPILKKHIKKKAPSKSRPATRAAACHPSGRCSARKWESEKGSSLYGYDNIQCSSLNKVSTDEAEKVMDEWVEKMDEEQLSKLPEYLTAYDGCYCKNHLRMDFFMPGGWWLGKVQDDRPEKPMLPKGSFKSGYETEFKELFWMFDKDGNKVRMSKGESRGWVTIKDAQDGIWSVGTALQQARRAGLEGRDISIKIMKDNSNFGFWMCPKHGNHAGGIVQTKGDLKQILRKYIGEAHSGWLCDFYVAPGASLRLIKEKLNQGFTIEFEDKNDKKEVEAMTGGGYKKGRRKRTLKNLTPEELEYFKDYPNLTTAAKKRLLKNPCWPSTETRECVKLMVKDNPWMLEEDGDKYVQGVVGKKSILNKEIKKSKKKSKKKTIRRKRTRLKKKSKKKKTRRKSKRKR